MMHTPHHEAPPDFNALAQPYHWLEFLTMGPHLERCRCYFLPQLTDARCALVYGDGDGRFLAKLLQANSQVKVDAVDSSANMLRLAKKRADALGTGQRLTLHHADARRFTPPSSSYDLFIAHFFVDCFSNAELSEILDCVSPHLSPEALVVVSEFAIVKTGLMGIASRTAVALLYRCFGLITGLRMRHLPDHRDIFAGHRFTLVDHKTWLAGLLVSELWQHRR